jgi:hypothetical protein
MGVVEAATESGVCKIVHTARLGTNILCPFPRRPILQAIAIASHNAPYHPNIPSHNPTHLFQTFFSQYPA